MFISADNTFYAYVKGGEKISAAFARVNYDEPFNTVRGDVTVTLEGPDFKQQTCVMPKDIPFGQGCQFAAQTATKSGIWRVQFIVPKSALVYPEVSSVVHWAKNWFTWNVTVSDSGGNEQHGRVWTERYAIRQPADTSYADDFVTYYISEDGYIYKAIELGYNGQISTLSADSIGIRKGDDCVSAYRSTEVSDKKYSPALGVCGSAYKLFFEEPAGDLPTKAVRWDGTDDWIRPKISRPSLSELHFTSDNSKDQQSGTISFFLHNFIGQYQIKVDVDNDGGFDGQSDVTIDKQMKELSDGLQRIHFSGVDKQGQIIPTSQKIGIRVVITKVAEIHLVAADVEDRTGGIELTRLSGDNAPTTRICWNDTELPPLTNEALMTKTLNGRDCPTSTGGVHGWAHAEGSWGDRRYIDDWVYASAKFDGNNQIVYPDEATEAVAATKQNWLVVAGVALVVVIVGVAVAIVLVKRRGNKLPPTSPTLTPPAPMPPEDRPPEEVN